MKKFFRISFNINITFPFIKCGTDGIRKPVFIILIKFLAYKTVDQDKHILRVRKSRLERFGIRLQQFFYPVDGAFVHRVLFLGN